MVSLTHGTDVRVTLEKGQKMTWTVPDKKSTNELNDFLTKRMYQNKTDEYMDRVKTLDKNLRTVYEIVWDMCTDAMHTKLRGVEGFSDMEKDLDALKLLKEIKKIVYNFEEKRYKQHNMYMAWRKFTIYDKNQTKPYRIGTKGSSYK